MDGIARPVPSSLTETTTEIERWRATPLHHWLRLKRPAIASWLNVEMVDGGVLVGLVLVSDIANFYDGVLKRNF